MKKYFVVVRLAFEKLMEYRFNFLMQIVTNIIWYGIMILFWLSIAQSGADIHPYTPQTLVVYFLLIGAIGTLVWTDPNIIGSEIRNGAMSNDVLRPINYFALKFFSTTADRLVMIFIAIVIFSILEILGFYNVNLGIWQILLFFASLFLSMIGNFIISLIVSLMAFWIKQVHGISALVAVVSGVFSGALIPVEYLPSSFSTISLFSPFRYYYYFPTQIFLGKPNPGDVLAGFGATIIWLLLCLTIVSVMWKNGLRRLEVVGT